MILILDGNTSPHVLSRSGRKKKKKIERIYWTLVVQKSHSSPLIIDFNETHDLFILYIFRGWNAKRRWRSYLFAAWGCVLRCVAGQLHSPNGDSDNSNGSQRAVAITRNDVEQQQQPHRQRHQRQAAATVPVLACTNQSSTTPTTTAFTVASSMLLLQTQVT